MTEYEAKAWVAARWPDESVDRLNTLVDLVVTESARQNLIAASTLETIWNRHIVDSLQLVAFAPGEAWLDIGTGAGFPGLAVAAAEPGRKVILVEPRKLRADFLRRSAEALGLSNVVIEARRIEQVCHAVTVISARAVASLDAIFAGAAQCAGPETVWLLPKGRNVDTELADARRKWHGVFHVEHSITSPDSHIVVATGVRRR